MALLLSRVLLWCIVENNYINNYLTGKFHQFNITLFFEKMHCCNQLINYHSHNFDNIMNNNIIILISFDNIL